MHTYELIVETATNTRLSNYTHNRKGLAYALRRVKLLQQSNKHLIAAIWSSKDNCIVYTTDQDFKPMGVLVSH